LGGKSAYLNLYDHLRARLSARNGTYSFPEIARSITTTNAKGASFSRPGVCSI